MNRITRLGRPVWAPARRRLIRSQMRESISDRSSSRQIQKVFHLQVVCALTQNSRKREPWPATRRQFRVAHRANDGPKAFGGLGQDECARLLER